MPRRLGTLAAPPARPLLRRRIGGVLLFVGVFMALSLAVRAALLLKSASVVAWDRSLLAVLAVGAAFDFGAACWASVPLTVVLVLLPARAFERRRGRLLASAAAFAGIAALVFDAAAEWVFWDEFGTRFNFIAVDYLVYTKEVVGNIRESYSVGTVLCVVAAVSALLFLAVRRTGLPAAWLSSPSEPFRRRAASAGVWLAVAVATGLALDGGRLPAFANNYNAELAKNGLWSLFAAFRNNELEYDRFYRTIPLDEAFAQLRHELAEDGSRLLSPDAYDTLRAVENPGPELRPNIVQITVESLSADFLGAFDPTSKLTPNLDVLAKRSLVFTNFFATGNRTDRGMEALTISMPPTPGRSLVKRPRNHGLFTLGSVLRSKGYETAFLYGGYGYFDNMNDFFEGNGYRVIDRASPSADVTFANVWGACDEDLYRWTLREADAAHARRKPFHLFVMTTSNHRPYTYPEGRIDLPPKVSGRAGAVKYTDHAIGAFLREAATRPWYRDTVFVVVADHCASSAGKTELPVASYHIPLIVFAPGGHVASGRIDTLASQIDYAPTLLGLLNWSYASRFFGHDVRKIDPSDAHALVGNYQKLGHVEHSEFHVLSPRLGESSYRFDVATLSMTPAPPTDDSRRETIAYYEAASHMYRNDLYRAIDP